MLQPSRAYIADPLGAELEREVGTRSFIVCSPIPLTADLPHGVEPCYLIDLTKLDPTTLERLITWVARRFDADPKQIATEMATKKNVFPVRKSQVSSVSMDIRMFP